LFAASRRPDAHPRARLFLPRFLEENEKPVAPKAAKVVGHKGAKAKVHTKLVKEAVKPTKPAKGAAKAAKDAEKADAKKVKDAEMGEQKAEAKRVKDAEKADAKKAREAAIATDKKEKADAKSALKAVKITEKATRREEEFFFSFGNSWSPSL
jgi:hypothetical protein